MTSNASPSYQNYIAGRFEPAADGRSFTATNPTTGQPWGSFADSGKADVDRAVQAASDALRGPWAKLSPSKRGRLMMVWGEKIAANADTIARLESTPNLHNGTLPR